MLTTRAALGPDSIETLRFHHKLNQHTQTFKKYFFSFEILNSLKKDIKYFVIEDI